MPALMSVTRSFLLAGFACALVGATVRTQQHLITWGQMVTDSRLHAESFVAVAAGRAHTVARRSDGSAVAWGDNIAGQCNVPALPPGLTYVAMAGGAEHTVAHRSDGSVVAWGRNGEGQCDVPTLPGANTGDEELAAIEIGKTVCVGGLVLIEMGLESVDSFPELSMAVTL